MTFEHDVQRYKKNLYSVAEGQQVLFSPGNLQFSTAGSHSTAEGTAIGTFRFAEHQYDYLGQAYALLFIDGLVNTSAECTYDKDRGYGRSVRLVKDAH